MCYAEVDLAMLSSHKKSYYFYKIENTLYMSRHYGRTDRTIFATFTYICLALGILPLKDLVLPAFDNSHWPESSDSDSQLCPGLDPRYVFCLYSTLDGSVKCVFRTYQII